MDLKNIRTDYIKVDQDWFQIYNNSNILSSLYADKLVHIGFHYIIARIIL